MARDFRTFQNTVSAGTAKATPATFNMSMRECTVRRIEVVVPDGCNGVVGFALGAAGQPVWPYDPGTFIVASGETVGSDVYGQIDSGAWQMFAYNTGKYSHTLYVRFYLDDPPAPVVPVTSAAAAVVLTLTSR